MTARFLSVLIACGLLGAAVSGCGGGASGLPQTTGPLGDAAANANPVTEPALAAFDREAAAKFEEYLADPGTPGVDYDPQRITVTYLPSAKLPSGIAAPAGPSQAAQGRNPVLRRNKQYEPLTDAIAARYGLGIDTQVYWGRLNFASFAVPEGADGAAILAALRADFASSIQYAYHSLITKAHFDPSDQEWQGSSATTGFHWGHHKIGCEQAWDITRGDPNVTIAVVDTGVRWAHEELGNVLIPADEVAAGNWPPGTETDVRNGDNDPGDTDGHGTFISGIVAAGANDHVIVGAANRCKIIPIKISNSGLSTDDWMAEGCLLGAVLGARSINLSWGREMGGPGGVFPLLATELDALGVLLVVSAGNDGEAATGDDPNWPAGIPQFFSVGSTFRADQRSSFSNFDATVDIAAPGDTMVSADVSGNNQYSVGSGTSFSAPMIASCAALLWSVAPALSVQEVKDILTSTGQPTTGFPEHTDMRRVDIHAALLAASGTLIRAPRPAQLIHSGTVTLTPTLIGTPDRVECWFNGSLAGTLTSAPWDFQVDTSAMFFGRVIAEFRAFTGAEMTSSSVELLVDNSGSTFPILEGFEPGKAPSFMPYDAKNLAQGPLNSLYNVPAGDQPGDVLASSGPGIWQNTGLAPRSGAGNCYCGQGIGKYGALEVDTLVSRRLTLPPSNPTLVFYHKMNIEQGDAGQAWDRGWVYVTADGGQSFTPATLNGGGQAFFSGLQTAWTKVEVNLSAFANQTVHVVFSLQSDDTLEGQDTAQNSGWWLDDVTIATNFNENVPTIGGVSLTHSVYGAVPSLPMLDPSIVQPDRVTKVRYLLDLQPLNQLDLYDKTVTVESGAPFLGSVQVPANQPNQLAQLKVQYFDSANNAGPEFTVPLYVFNKPGDVNGDNKVDAADQLAFPAKLGLKAADAGYVPFYDSDLDGTITEADFSAIGYHWKP